MLLTSNLINVLNTNKFKISLLHSFFTWNTTTNTWAFSKDIKTAHLYEFIDSRFKTIIDNKPYYWEVDKTNLILTDKPSQTTWEIIMDYYNVTLKFGDYTLTSNLISTPLNSRMATFFYFHTDECISLDYLINRTLIGIRSVWSWMIQKDKHTKRTMDDGKTIAINRIMLPDESTLLTVNENTLTEIIIELLFENGTFYFESRMPTLIDSLVSYAEYDGMSLVSKSSLVLNKDPLMFHWINNKFIFCIPQRLTFNDITNEPTLIDRSNIVFFTRNNKKLQINPLASNYSISTELVDYYLTLPPNILIENKQYYPEDTFDITLINAQNERFKFNPLVTIAKPIYAPYQQITFEQAFSSFVENKNIFTWENVDKYKYWIIAVLFFILFF
jgi:hypothetical protein